MLKLKFKDQRQPALWLVESSTALGSDPKNQVVISDPGVAPLHARILKEGDALFIEDAAGKNTTSVNGTPIRQKFQLRPGDKIQLAAVELDIIDAREDQSAGSQGPKSDWSILGMTGELKGKSIPIKDAMVFGRSSQCDIVINDAHMSRRHAEISLRQNVLRLVDLQSSNGTSVNNQKIGERVLRPGDKIQFDHVRFLVVGPLNAEVPVDEAEEDDDETLFRAAPIPRRAPAPGGTATARIPLSATSAPTRTSLSGSHVPASTASGRTAPTVDMVSANSRSMNWLPVIITGVVLLMAFLAGVGVVLLG